MFDGRRDAAFLVACRNDDGKPFERDLTRCRAASAIDMSTSGALRNLEPSGFAVGMVEDLLAGSSSTLRDGAPLPRVAGEAGIEHHPRQIERARLSPGFLDRVVAEPFAAPVAELRAATWPTGRRRRHSRSRGRPRSVHAIWRSSSGTRSAGCRQSRTWWPLSAEAEVAQRPAMHPAVDPVGEDPLIGAAELAGAGEHAAPVDPHGKAVGRSRTRAPAARWPAWSRRRARPAPRSRSLPSTPGRRQPGGSGPRRIRLEARRPATATGSAASGGIEYTRLVLSRTSAAW